MGRISDTARVTRAGVKHGKDADSVQERSWLLYTRARSACDDSKSAKAMPDKDGVAGFRYEGTLKRHLLSLFPEKAHLSAEDYATFERPIYSYLRATGNAICLVPSARPPVWWIRKEFNEVATVMVPVGTATHKDKLEAKVTPEEAGETREPGPVTVTKATDTAEPVQAAVEDADRDLTLEDLTFPLRTQHAIKARVVEVLNMLRKYDEPVTAVEVAYLRKNFRPPEGQQKHPTAGGETMTALNVAVRMGLLFSRLETSRERGVRAGFTSGQQQWPAGRLGTLYSLHDPVPARTRRDLVGYLLEVPNLNLTSEARKENFAKQVDRRNELVLDVLVAAGRKLTTTELQEALLARNEPFGVERTRDALKQLKELGLAHSKVRENGQGNYWLPVDKEFVDELTPEPEVPAVAPEPVKIKSEINWEAYGPTERAIARWVVLQTKAFTSLDIAESTGFSESTAHKVLRGALEGIVVRKGNNKRRFSYEYVGAASAAPVPAAQPAQTPPKETPVADPRLAAVPTPEPAPALPMDANALLQMMITQAVEAQVAPVREETQRMREALAQIAKIAGDAAGK